MSTSHPIGTVLLHPGEWPWRRLTGFPAEVPEQGADLTAWRVQPLCQLEQVLRHPS